MTTTSTALVSGQRNSTVQLYAELHNLEDEVDDLVRICDTEEEAVLVLNARGAMLVTSDRADFVLTAKDIQLARLAFPEFHGHTNEDNLVNHVIDVYTSNPVGEFQENGRPVEGKIDVFYQKVRDICESNRERFPTLDHGIRELERLHAGGGQLLDEEGEEDFEA